MDCKFTTEDTEATEDYTENHMVNHGGTESTEWTSMGVVAEGVLP